MSTYTIPTKFTAVDGVSSVVKGMEHNIHSFAEKANAGIARQERLFRKLTPGLSSATKQLLNYASAGAVLGGVAYSGKAIADYETAIQSLQAVTGVSTAELDIFKTQITDVANKSKKSATDVAGSFEVIGSAMSQYLQDPKALRQISEAGITLAKASRQELVPTLENLTSIMNQFDLKAGQATDTINRLTAGEIVGSLRTSQVAEALQEFGAGAFAANVNLSESVALVEALGKQMKVDKIGVGARNILTVLDSAKGLDKKARKDLRKSGVDLSFLMDKTQSLSARLRELSKIQGNSTVITSVFGKENKTAAQVIFNQLDTYDAYLAKIRTTNEAQKQAETNSKTLSVTVAELRDTWINYISTNDKTAVGLEKIKMGIGYVTANMDTIISVGVNVIKIFALWKAAIVAQQIVMGGYSIAVGLNSAIVGASSLAMKGNTIALAAQRAALLFTTDAQYGLNAAMAANPVGIIVTGLAALAAGLYLASEREERLREEYQKQIDLNISKETDRQTEAVKRLVSQYWHLGQGIKDATVSAIKFNANSIDMQRAKVEARIKQTELELEKEKNKLYLADLFYGGGTPEVGKRKELAEQLTAQQSTALNLATDKASLADFTRSQVEKGVITDKDASQIFRNDSKSKTQPITNDFQRDLNFRETDKNFKITDKNPEPFDYVRLGAEIAKAIKGSQKLDVNIIGLPNGTTAKASNGNISTTNTY